ncbi:MAG: PEP-CTERM sorting domain-containing protein [Planctomycetaceae bacterium]
MSRRINPTLSRCFALAMVAAATNAACAAELFVLGQPTVQLNNQTTSFGSINTVTGTYTPISLSGFVTGTNLVNLAYDHGIDRFYTSTGDQGSDSFLRTLSKSGSVSASIGLINKNIYAMWYASGTLRAYNRTNQDVGTINTTAGSYAFTANANVTVPNRIGGRGSILSGVNYFINTNNTASSSLFGSINLATGAFTTIGSANSLFQNMVLASDGVDLYGLRPVNSGTSELYTINVTTGQPTKLVDVTPAFGTVPLQYSGAAFAVPEPSAVALALSGVAGLLAAARRRRRGRVASSTSSDQTRRMPHHDVTVHGRTCLVSCFQQGGESG